MDQKVAGRWAHIRDRKLADPALRERYERTRSAVALTRAVLQAIDARREKAGLSKAELAQRAGLHPSAIRRMLTSQTSNPTLKTVAEILDVLGLELALQAKPPISAAPARRRAASRGRTSLPAGR